MQVTVASARSRERVRNGWLLSAAVSLLLALAPGGAFAADWQASPSNVASVSSYARLGNRVDRARSVPASYSRAVPSSSSLTGWNLVFSDDFNGDRVNTNAWGLYNGPGHNGNGLRRPSAFSVKNGLLVVTAQMLNGKLVSGGMAHRTGYRYGRFEFRVRTEPDPSRTTNGIVLTWPQSGSWPADGENDIYETGTDADRNPFATFIHYGADNSQHWYHHDADGTQWHTMAMEWEPGVIRIYRDGALVYTLTDVTAIPDVAHNLCIQLDALKPAMTGIVRMYVDYVRIYQKA